MPKTRPCLWFDHQGEEAAEFYTSVFPNSKILDVTRYFEGSPGPAGSVMTVLFELDGQQFTALNGGPVFTFNEAVSFEIQCKDQAEIDYYWKALTDGGSEQPCGWLKDKYGVSWQVVPGTLVEMLKDPESERSQRVMNAMLRMKKLDIAELRRAYAG
jgi:predicted 3-demethylubiquinone-9 3-methyltransferase (glyoxalase superfamily)